MLQIALPNKGTLSEEALRLVREAGYQCRRYGRELVVRDSTYAVEFIFLRPRDIAVYVSNGVLALGITGRDLARDSRSDLVELLPLGFGKSDFYYAVPKHSSLTPDQFTSQHRIATSYPNLVHDDLSQRRTHAEVIRLDGAVEISIQLGVADAIADVVQSGRTLDEAGLKKTGDPILSSEAILVGQNEQVVQEPTAHSFIERLRGIVVAREYVLVEYDVPKLHLEAACAITPGIESPTIAPLSKPDWVAVKAMARSRDTNDIMDQLARLGATGILVTEIRTCRI